ASDPLEPGNVDRQVAIAALGAQATLERATVLGRTAARRLETSDSLFTGLVQITQQQTGCARFCYLPEGSRTPRRYRCQPDLALAEAVRHRPHPITALLIGPAAPLAGSLGQGLFQYLAADDGSAASWQPVGQDSALTLNITALGQHPDDLRLWVGTLEGDIFESSDGGSIWTWLSQDLAEALPAASPQVSLNTRITDFALTADRALLLIATAGNGILRYALADPEPPESRWQRLGRAHGLIDETVMALAVSLDGDIFAGTLGGVFRSTDQGQTWTAVNRGLTHRQISAIALHSQTGLGTIRSQGTQVTGQATQFQRSLQIGDTITAAGQTRTVTSIPSDQMLNLARPFEPELSEFVEFVITSRTDLFVTTAGGGVFRSTDKGSSWAPINDGLTNLDVTTLAIDPAEPSPAASQDTDCLSTTCTETPCTETTDCMPQRPYTVSKLFVGTAGSGVFEFSPQTERWDSADNEVSQQVITALAINSEDSSDLLVGNSTGIVWRSTSGGNTWTLLSQGLPDVEKILPILAQLQPAFTAKNYGDPGYGQLALNCPIELRTGAEDGAEMGAFNYLKQPQREANLRASLREYLRFGLEAGIFYMT
ncbi:MAG: hypothetical protein F6J97_18910, partial [Leptolyngbya sp. SIO4C1]|nr:hypothetical protein [Leptolyngbya sp. SIO4C1]